MNSDVTAHFDQKQDIMLTRVECHFEYILKEGIDVEIQIIEVTSYSFSKSFKRSIQVLI